MTKELAKSDTTTEVSTVVTYDYGEHSRAGFEDTSPTDLSLPFINVLQSNSPEVEGADPEDKNAPRAGMLKNSVTGDIVKGTEGIPFLAVHEEHVVLEWVPRNKGGGLAAVHQMDSEVVRKAIAANGGSIIPQKGADGKRKPLTHGENDLVETHSLYCLLLSQDGTSVVGFAVIGFASTKIKPFKDFKTSIYMLRGKPPIYAARAVLKTVKQINNNQSFYNVSISPLLGGNWLESLIPPSSELLKEAVAFREMIVSGLTKVDYSSQRDDQSGSHSEAPERSHNPETGEDLPF